MAFARGYAQVVRRRLVEGGLGEQLLRDQKFSPFRGDVAEVGLTLGELFPSDHK